jgi:1,4-dihydroxy-2-naphthoyl-CoA hydrolase
VPTRDLERLRAALAGTLPELFGIELLRAEHGELDARLPLRPEFRAPEIGFLHAGTTLTLADSCCGLGCYVSLPEGATRFTTLELKANFLRTAAPPDALRCEARMAHGGRTTQVWDASVTREGDGKPVALFRCTQYLLA